MTTSGLREDEPESDDQGLMWNSLNSPLTPLSKPVLKADGFGCDSAATLLTSSLSCSSRKSHNYFNDSSYSVAFNDNNLVNIIEIDCDYTEERISELWFTKVEYDEFLQACDDDAQKCEEHEKETHVNKLKKEIKRQRRQRRKEEKHLLLQEQQQNAQAEGLVLDESMHSMGLETEAEDIHIDDIFEDDDIRDSKREINEDEEGWRCSYGLEAWTLEGYKEREYHRQKAIDAVLNEQYTAWDRGMVENSEMMSALYFAASATSKHSASKKARELEEDVQEATVVSTLDDYNKAVQALNVLQKSLHCIHNKSKKSHVNIDRWSKSKRRGSNESAASIGTATSIVDRALAIREQPIDQAPQQPIKPPLSSSSLLSNLPPSPASSSSRKKYKQRVKVSGTPHKIYKSKAAMNIIVAPPTPPVTKRRTVVYKPSQGGRSKLSIGCEDPQFTKSPRSRKIVYKPIVGGQPPKIEGARRDKSPGTKKKTKKKQKHEPQQHEQQEKNDHKGDRTRSRSRSRSRGKSPRPVAISNKDSNEASAAGKLPKKHSSPTRKSRKLVNKTPPNVAFSVLSDSTTQPASLSTHTSSSHRKNSKKEHWWFQQQKQACQ